MRLLPYHPRLIEILQTYPPPGRGHAWLYRVALHIRHYHTAEATFALLRDGRSRKGDALTVAQLAGVQAAKRTAELIPLCHSIALTFVGVELVLDEGSRAVEIEATCRTRAETGVEMEALTAASVAALTVYDMCKSAERGIRITDLRLVRKSGGRSGEWVGE